jgi:hypothetical protein
LVFADAHGHVVPSGHKTRWQFEIRPPLALADGGQVKRADAILADLANRHRERFIVFSSRSLLKLRFHVNDHFVRSVEGAVGAPVLNVFVGFGESGIDDTALRWGVFIIGIREQRAVDNELGCNYDLLAHSLNFHQVAVRKSDSGAHFTGNGHLLFTLEFYEGAHGSRRLISEIRDSGFCLPV